MYLQPQRLVEEPSVQQEQQPLQQPVQQVEHSVQHLQDLNINATTGVIDLAGSTPGTYTVTYSFGTAPCNGTATSSVTVSVISNSNR